MKELMLDLKIFHKWTGRYLFKMYAKLTMRLTLVSAIFAILNLLNLIAISWVLIIFFPIGIVVSALLSYFVMFLDDKRTIAEAKKEVRMESKYSTLFSKFNKTL